MSLHATEIQAHLSEKAERPMARLRFWRRGRTYSVLPGHFAKRRTRRVKKPAALAALALVSLTLFYLLLLSTRHGPEVSQQLPKPPRHVHHVHHSLTLNAIPRNVSVPGPLPLRPLPTLPDMGEEYGVVNTDELSIVLPVDSDSLVHLPSLLAPFFISPDPPGEILVGCPSSIADQVHATVQATLQTLRQDAFDVHVSSWSDDFSAGVGLLHISAASSFEWVLILDEKGLQEISAETISSLLSPQAFPLPSGPRGAAMSPINVTCITSPADTTIAAAFLLPPFVISRALLIEVENGLRGDSVYTWAAVGEKIAGLRGLGAGGVVIGTRQEGPAHDSEWCRVTQFRVLGPESPGVTAASIEVLHEMYRAFEPSASSDLLKQSPRFVVLIPTLHDLRVFAATLCRISSRGHVLKVLVSGTGPNASYIVESGCHLHYDVLLMDEIAVDFTDDPWATATQLHSWMSTHARNEDIFLHAFPDGDNWVLHNALDTLKRGKNLTIVGLPSRSLSASVWLAELTIEEWQSWHVPLIELNVITNDRPSSLERLLSSLQAAHYFGDRPRLTISLDQAADTHTLAIAENLQWPAGDLFLRHRVVHGGLMPAIVESWYPSSNHTYGALLEDDVEVSPMFYAWLKFGILRYRYGSARRESSRMFGISLYQQKHVELRPEGRRPFDARRLFSTNAVRYPNTPYLSQIPCSWGAVYFPEHWREFHAYLNLRLSEAGQHLPSDLVPDIRSNRWTRSWKKYFIELTYLRGYVMLYPNYNDFVSLSTNHLELGAHVRELPERLLAKKKAQFQVPLMSTENTGYGHPIGLLNLPQGTLPLWDSLPVLDLWGNMSSHEEIVLRGAYRHEEVSECRRPLDPGAPTNHRAADLLCVQEEPEEEDEVIDGIFEEDGEEDELDLFL